jgi:hypothetical protein
MLTPQCVVTLLLPPDIQNALSRSRGLVNLSDQPAEVLKEELGGQEE